MSSAPVPTATESNDASQQIGMSQVLDHVRERNEIGLAHVVEFNGVTKTYNDGTNQAFTAVRDVNISRSDSTAGLNWMVAAPLDADSW